jgi:hypothetical protein
MSRLPGCIWWPMAIAVLVFAMVASLLSAFVIDDVYLDED